MQHVGDTCALLLTRGRARTAAGGCCFTCHHPFLVMQLPGPSRMPCPRSCQPNPAKPEAQQVQPHKDHPNTLPRTLSAGHRTSSPSQGGKGSPQISRTECQGQEGAAPGAPVLWEAQSPKVAGRLHALVAEVVDSEDAAGVLVHAVAPVPRRQVAGHHGRMPVVGHEQHLLAVREARGLARPAHMPVCLCRVEGAGFSPG